MLSLKANKKLIQDKLASTTGKVVLLKDLSNISSRMKMGNTRNDVQESIRKLTEVYGKSTLSSNYIATQYCKATFYERENLCKFIRVGLSMNTFSRYMHCNIIYGTIKIYAVQIYPTGTWLT